MEMFRITSIVLVFCALCASEPLPRLPILKEAPSEVLFKVDGKSELVLECSTVDKDEGVQYSWQKNGKPFTLTTDIKQRENEGTLIFKKPAIQDEGEYQCLAKTNLGVASTRTISVRRTYIDVPQITLQKHKPIEGKYYKLDCHLPNAYPKPEINWYYQSLTDPSISRKILNYRIVQSPGGSLFFTNVTSEDISTDHKYVCTATSGAIDSDVVLAEHVMEDMVPRDGDYSELVPLYVSPDMITKVGDVTMIYCIYGGTPLAYPDWYKDGKNTNNNPQDRVTRYNRTGGKRLLIKDTWLSDQGEYTCIVDNEVGKPQNHTMHLTVVSSPKFVKRAEPKIVANVGDNVALPCQVTGVPIPKISWTYNKQALPAPVVLRDSLDGNTIGVEIVLKNIKKTDTGYFSCVAENEHGSVYTETLVYVQ